MDLPELRRHLTKFLTRSELATAARVCKSWQESFTPILYREIIWSEFDRTPSPQSIVANAGHIRLMGIYSEPLNFPLEIFTNLESVTLGFRVSDPKTWIRLATLLRQNPELRRVLASIDGQSKDVHVFMEALASSCPKLQTLGVSTSGLDVECSQLLWDTCVRVKVLNLVDARLDSLGSMDRWAVFPNMQRLEMNLSWGLTAEQQLEIIRRSPQLRSLIWDLDMNEQCLSTLPNIIATRCPHLEVLKMTGGKLSGVEVSSILDSCQRLSTLILVTFEFDARAALSLRRHFPHLVHLDIERCDSTTSAMIQQLMTSCPRLEYLAADRLDVRDILGVAEVEMEEAGRQGEHQEARQTFQPQDWACTNLRSFTIFICGLEGKPNEWQREVLKQLSRLTKLSTLRIGCWGTKPSRDGLDMRLQSGLDILSGLNLQELGFKGVWQELEEEDVMWMVEAWPKLQYVTGTMNYQTGRQKELQRALAKHTVRRRGPHSGGCCSI
ncbi:hypothetical protein B0O80DRAFT_135441 [Mortierella sp. GBAus27b]|nr:hypothetical protein B0O80DRAFT_135441 [Mortierella sp. GBAus27b]